MRSGHVDLFTSFKAIWCMVAAKVPRHQWHVPVDERMKEPGVLAVDSWRQYTFGKVLLGNIKYPAKKKLPRKTDGKDPTCFFNGDSSTISTGPFLIAMLVYQFTRGYICHTIHIHTPPSNTLKQIRTYYNTMLLSSRHAKPKIFKLSMTISTMYYMACSFPYITWYTLIFQTLVFD